MEYEEIIIIMLNLKSNGLILHEVINPKNPLVAIVPPSAKF
jgi:hypothetical protein